MADELVTIRIRVTASNQRQVKQLTADLVALGAASNTTNAKLNTMGKSLSNRVNPSFDKFRKNVFKVTGLLAGLNKFGLKALLISLGVAAASLASVNAAFAIGRAVMQAWNWTMRASAAGVAALAAGLVTLAAAQRQYNAAVQASSYAAGQESLQLGLSRSRNALRSLQTDTRLSLFGMEELNNAFAALSKSGRADGRSFTALRGIADFAAAGGDFQAAAAFIALLQEQGKVTEEVLSAASQVSASFGKEVKKAYDGGAKSAEQMLAVVSSTALTDAAGVTGQADLVGRTLVGQFKTFTTQIVGLAGDIGQNMLRPVGKAMQEIFNIIETTLRRIAPEFVQFGSGDALDGLVDGLQKISDWFVNWFREYLPQANGLLDGFKSAWGQIKFVFEEVTEALRPLLDGGRVIIDIFGPLFGTAFSAIGRVIQTVDRLVVGNSDQWMELGASIERAVDIFGDFIVTLVEGFDKALPIINPLIDAILALANAFVGLGSVMQGLPGIFGNLGGLATLAGGIGLNMFARNRLGRRGLGTGGATAGPGAIGSFMSSPFGFVTAGMSRMGDTGYGPNRRATYLQGRQAGFTRKESFYLARTAHQVPGGLAGSYLPSMAIAGLTPFVDQEAQGGMMTGATIAGLAPTLAMANPALGAAAIGVGGTVAGYSIMKNARTGGGGALGGAMMGASIGGMVGSVVPIIGTAAGAIIGGAIGAVGGWLRGNENKKRNEVREKINEFMTNIMQDVGQAAVTGNADAVLAQIDAAKQRVEGFGQRLTTGTLTEEEQKILGDNPDFIALSEYTEAIAEQQKQLEYLRGPAERFNASMEQLTKLTGKSEEEIKSLANELGVNLWDDTVQFTDVLKQMGVVMEQTAEQIIGASRDIVIQAMGFLDAQISQLDARSVYQETLYGLRKSLSEGIIPSQRDLLVFSKTILDSMMMEWPDDPLKAVEAFGRFFGTGGDLYQTGEYLQQFPELAAALQPIIDQLNRNVIAEQSQTLATQLAGQIAGTGYSVDQASLAAQLSIMDISQLMAVQQALIQGTIPGALNRSAGGMGALDQSSSLESALANLGIKAAIEEIGISTRNAETIAEEEAAAREAFFNTATSLFTQKPVWWNDYPKLLDADGDGVLDSNDTPTSRLAMTMAKHNRLDSMLTGTRTVTSSYRTSGLGSINSDHATGNAYDLVGQNLGAYSRLVNLSGGFAEFHGRGGNRHLHVVPGQDTPIGDTSMPAMIAPAAAGSVSNNYSIVVNGADSSPREIARAVMLEIERKQRSSMERQ